MCSLQVFITLWYIHQWAHFSSFHSLHQLFSVENLHHRLVLSIFHLHDVTLFILLPLLFYFFIQLLFNNEIPWDRTSFPRETFDFHLYLWLSCGHNLFSFHRLLKNNTSACPCGCVLFVLCDATNCESWMWLVTMNTWRFKTWLNKVLAAVLRQ